MQTCNCSNTYKFPEKGTTVCVICGDDWPEDVEATPEEEKLAKELFFAHAGLMNKDKSKFEFIWDNATLPVRQAWVTIAEADLKGKSNEDEA